MPTGAPVAITEDLHALGAVLYFLATGAEPSRAPDAEDPMSRPPAALNPAIGASLVTIIACCLSDDPARRYPNVREVGSALAAARADDQRGGEVIPAAPPVTRGGALRLARRAADRICSEAEGHDDGLVWRSRYFVGKGLVGRDVSAGMAGTILCLAELAEEFRDPAHLEVLRRGTSALIGLRPLPGDERCGLYIGDTGVVAALLRAGQVLGDGGVVEVATRRARAEAGCPLGSPDVFHGAAGRLLVNLLVWDETQDPEFLSRATAIGEALLDMREGGAGEARWRIPPGYADLSGKSYLGYAHGAAGIADTLLDLFEATGNERFAEAATDAITWIGRQAVAVLDDDTGFGWPQVEGGPPHPPFWCHGAGGIARLRARQLVAAVTFERWCT